MWGVFLAIRLRKLIEDPKAREKFFRRLEADSHVLKNVEDFDCHDDPRMKAHYELLDSIGEMVDRGCRVRGVITLRGNGPGAVVGVDPVSKNRRRQKR